VVVAWARPGRTVILAERFNASPVGPYSALSVGRLTRVGLRIGVCFTAAVLDNHDALMAGRRNWGFPGELGTLTWGAFADETVVVWHERDVTVRGVARGRRWPLAMAGHGLQRRGDGQVVVPARLRGFVRRAAVSVEVPADDEWAPLAGTHNGVMGTGVSVRLLPARLPAGLVWTSLAPARAPEIANCHQNRGL
jgi:hypothetical protein